MRYLSTLLLVTACSGGDPTPAGRANNHGSGGSGASASGGAGGAGVGGASAGAGGTAGIGGAAGTGGAGATADAGAGASSGAAGAGGSGESGTGSGGTSDRDGAVDAAQDAGGGTGGAGGVDGATCPFSGNITYSLARNANPTPAEQNAYALITAAMDKAIGYYNCHTNITKHANVSYVPSVATADGNINGSMRFGSNTSYMDYRTAMHELSHLLGVGQAANWRTFVVGGLFTGANANAQLTEINRTLQTPLDTQLHADASHFWPYGINQQSEVKSEADLIAHCKIVMAIRKDLGLQ